jgi:hypothetical protein
VWECGSVKVIDEWGRPGERERVGRWAGWSKNEWWGQGLIFNVRHMKKKGHNIATLHCNVTCNLHTAAQCTCSILINSTI